MVVEFHQAYETESCRKGSIVGYSDIKSKNIERFSFFTDGHSFVHAFCNSLALDFNDSTCYPLNCSFGHRSLSSPE